MGKKERTVYALDVGTTKVCMLIARPYPDGRLKVLSSGCVLSDGLKKGIVVNLGRAAESIGKAAEDAELKSGISADWVTVGISGDHIQSFNCHGAIPIERKHHTVTEEDMAQVIAAAQSIPIPPEREILHVLPQEFFVDTRGGILNPVGLTGSRLDVDIHVVTGDTRITQNLINAVNRAQMRVHKVILQQLASAESVLSRDEKELGAALVDIGGGTTNIALFAKNSIRYSTVLPVGGFNFTRDLAIGLRTPIEDAEIIKKAFGSVLIEEAADDEVIEVPNVGNCETREIPRKMACKILRDRAIETVQHIKEQLELAGDGVEPDTGVVLTGGGSLLNGFLELAEEVIEMPVRQGVPQGIEGLTDGLSSPIYSAAVGLAMLAAQEDKGLNRYPTKPSPSPWWLHRALSWISK